jgi:pimeloyl-ACP methyl ester carboxylesterase
MAERGEMAAFVLVHGGNISSETWNKLSGREDYPSGIHIGGGCWNGTASALIKAGHEVFAPTLADSASSHLDGHIGEICGLMEKQKLSKVILVGHSYGGMVITGVADRIPERISRLVYLDAALPEPGQSLYDIIEVALALDKSPKALLPQPDPPYVQKIIFDKSGLDAIRKTYIRCMNSDFLFVTRLAKEKIESNHLNWTFLELFSSHVPMADAPDAFNRILLDIASV